MNTQFVEARNRAFIQFVENDDKEAIMDYCKTYDVPLPDNPDVLAAGVYKAVQEVTDIPDDVKQLAAQKCRALGFKDRMSFRGGMKHE